MLYEISNPSDAYTIQGEFRDAALATLFLGQGNYGLHAEDGSEGLPIFILGGSEAWLAEHGFDLVNLSNAELERAASVLDTIMIGDFADRREAESAMARMKPEDARDWLDARHDRRRSSMNDIAAKARRIAAAIREKAKERKAHS